MPVERRVFGPLLWRASSLLGIARSIELSWFGCRSERTGATYHIRGESQEEISVMGTFTNLIQCDGVEGGDGVWVDSCSGGRVAARSRAGPSIKFRGFGRDNKITEDCLDFFERTDSIRPSSPRLMFPRRSPSEVGLSCFRRVFLWRGGVQVLDIGIGFGTVAVVI